MAQGNADLRAGSTIIPSPVIAAMTYAILLLNSDCYYPSHDCQHSPCKRLVVRGHSAVCSSAMQIFWYTGVREGSFLD